MANILFLFEGERTEEKYYKVIKKSFPKDLDKNVKFFYYGANIHALYTTIKEDESLNMIELLKERAKSTNDIEHYEMLENTKFGEIYLIFDLDPQDDQYNPTTIAKMLKLFDNETEHGKLYINYPMVESFKHFKTIPDSKYNTYKVKVSKCISYKKDVANLSCVNDFRKITKEQYYSIVKQNVEKINFLINNKKSYDFNKYREKFNQKNIFMFQRKEIKKNNQVYILNSFCLWPIDYFGKNTFDEIIKS